MELVMSIILLALILFQPIEINEYNLENGLKILVYEDHFAPVVSAQVHYRVGSYNEPSGLTGISHMLEHMAFRGSKNYPPREYSRIIEATGGYDNAYTSIHVTVYHASLRSDRYEIQLELEADRMQNLLILPEEFEPERGVVMEERRLQDNDPYDNLFEQLDLMSYTYSPYRHAILGFMSDIENYSRDDVYNWYKKHYNPANAIIVVSGDVNPDEVFKIVKKYYGKMKGKEVKEDVYIEPPQEGERRFELKKDVSTPALAMQYQTIPITNNDMYALDVMAMILSSGMSSRFEKNLVREKGMASRIDIYHYNFKYTGSFSILGIPQTGIEIETLEKAINYEIERLKKEPVTDAELKKAKNQALAKAVYRLDSVQDIGFEIGMWEIEAGGWENMNHYPQEIQKVTIEDIMEIAKKYFDKDKRSVGYLLPR